MAHAELDPSNADALSDILSDADDTESEAETLPDIDHGDAAEGSSSAARCSNDNSSASSSRVVAQAAKAIEAAEDREPVSSQRRVPTRLQAQSVVVNEETPLLDAGPAQPPPDYAAATAGRRLRTYDESISSTTVIPQAPEPLPSIPVFEHATAQSSTPQPGATSTSSTRTTEDIESGVLKEQIRKRRVLHRVCKIIYEIVRVLLMMLYRLFKLLGTALYIFVQRCTVLTVCLLIGVIIAILIILLLEKLDKI